MSGTYACVPGIWFENFSSDSNLVRPFRASCVYDALPYHLIASGNVRILVVFWYFSNRSRKVAHQWDHCCSWHMDCQLGEDDVPQKKEWFEFRFKKMLRSKAHYFFHGTHRIWPRQTHRPPRKMYARLLLWRSQSQPVYHGIIATPSLLHSRKSKVIVALIATLSWESGVPISMLIFQANKPFFLKITSIS